MKLLGYLLLVSLVLAAIKAAVVALIVAASFAGIVSLIKQPRATLLALLNVSITVAFVAHPLMIALLFAGMSLVTWIAKQAS